MRENLLLTAVAGVAALVMYAASDLSSSLQAQAGVALTGRVVSDEEGPMEGVVVTARKEHSNISISVVTDNEGRYTFPDTTLNSGDYLLKIRATGYELLGPSGIDVRSGVTAGADISLRETKNLAAQLADAEWLASVPGSDQQKKFLLSCNGCHSYQPIVNSTHDPGSFLQVFERMAGYYPGSTLLHPQRLVGAARVHLGGSADAAKWLATVNLSRSPTRGYLLKALPRPVGRATRAIVTEYDLPRKTIAPHDVIVDSDGMVWYSDSGALLLGRMDPRTGKVTEYPIPRLEESSPVGTLDLESDREGNLWVALMYQRGVAKLDKKTGTIQTWSVPKEWQTDASRQSVTAATLSHVDGKVWINNAEGAQILRLDTATNTWENFGPLTDPETKRTISSLGINADRNSNLYLLDVNAGNIGILDGATRKLEIVRTPSPDSRLRRGSVDAQNRLWFADHGGNAIGMLDPKTRQIKEWPMPTAWFNPHDVAIDRNGEAWAGSMMSDRIVRLDTRTGQFTEYLLPSPTNIRRVWVDNSTNPVTLWAGSHHGASIVRLEPLD